jgi:outer membrane protein OmpA-like peptidoglycan-associated protein
LFPALPGFELDSRESGQGELAFFLERARSQKVTGQRTLLEYRAREGYRAPSPSQILKLLVDDFRDRGGRLLHQGETLEDDLAATLKLERAGRETWVSIVPGPGQYRLALIERILVKPEITAEEILAGLEENGFAPVPLRFDPGKAVLKAGGPEVVAEIARLLRDEPALRLSIEGHTDNRGNPKANKSLSESRARAVLQVLISSGVDAKRLKAVGWGAEKPIADNRTAQGRARNERIELVKQ